MMLEALDFTPLVTVDKTREDAGCPKSRSSLMPATSWMSHGQHHRGGRHQAVGGSSSPPWTSRWGSGSTGATRTSCSTGSTDPDVWSTPPKARLGDGTRSSSRPPAKPVICGRPGRTIRRGAPRPSNPAPAIRPRPTRRNPRTPQGAHPALTTRPISPDPGPPTPRTRRNAAPASRPNPGNTNHEINNGAKINVNAKSRIRGFPALRRDLFANWPREGATMRTRSITGLVDLCGSPLISDIHRC
jgi:hypothetical protein